MGHALESILHYPYLKVELLSTLDWSHHIDNKDNKANQTLGFLRRNLSNCPGSIKELAYKALVRPHLEYASQVWDQRMDKHISGIEAVRQRSAQVVKDCWEWTPELSQISLMIWIGPLYNTRESEKEFPSYIKRHNRQLWSSQNDRFIELGPTETLFNPFAPELAKTGWPENTSLFLNRPKLAVDDAFVFGLPPHPKGQIWAKQMNHHCSLVIGQSYYKYCP